jgi:serine/threonine-protein kinase
MVERNLRDRYRLERRIGLGGMATVFEGFDTVLRRRVAIKVLRPQFAADEEFVKRFYVEAQHAAKLSHPNVVSIYDVGREDETYFIVMELVDGATLAEMIEAGPLPEAVAIDFAAQVCNGLSYAHRQGLLHRDIKPANILVTKDDVVKLSDFGIARAVTTQTVTMTSPGMVLGSVYYISPEQAQGFDLRETSDLYSLGVVLYQMLTGKLPYSGESPVTVALKHVSSPIPRVEANAPGSVSPALAAIVQRLMQKEPADRFATALEVATALREARDSPLSATPFDVPGASTTGRRRTAQTIPQPKARPSRFPDRAPGANQTGQGAGEPARDGVRRSASRVGLFAMLGVILLAAIAGGYWFSSRAGGLFGAAPTVAVANLAGRTADDAEKALTAAGLGYSVTTAASETVPAGRVIRQDPPPNGRVPSHAVVQLIVSSGLPVVDLTDLRQFDRDDAVRLLQRAKLKVKVTGKYDQAPKDQVLSQVPLPGARLPIHSVVALVVSKGLEPVNVPEIVSLSLDDARKAAAARKLTLVIGQRVNNDSIPANVVTTQDPQPGAPVDPGSSITVVVSDGPQRLAIPDVGGRSLADATTALEQAGFSVHVNYVEDASGPNGTVMNESPGANARAPKGSTVTLQVSESGVVPSLRGKSLEDARSALLNAGYRVGSVTYVPGGAPGVVVGSDPAEGETLSPGSNVDLQIGSVAPSASPSAVPPSPGP